MKDGICPMCGSKTLGRYGETEHTYHIPSLLAGEPDLSALVACGSLPPQDDDDEDGDEDESDGTPLEP